MIASYLKIQLFVFERLKRQKIAKPLKTEVKMEKIVQKPPLICRNNELLKKEVKVNRLFAVVKMMLRRSEKNNGVISESRVYRCNWCLAL